MCGGGCNGYNGYNGYNYGYGYAYGYGRGYGSRHNGYVAPCYPYSGYGRGYPIYPAYWNRWC